MEKYFSLILCFCLLSCKLDRNSINSQLIVQKVKETNSYSVNVKTFGAKGNGVNNDTKAIQNAIDKVILIKNNGQTKTFSNIVYIPCGIYLVDGLILKRGVTIQGEGEGCVEFILSKKNGTLFKSLDDTKNNQYIKIRNISLNGNGNDGVGIDLTYANFDSHIKNCIVSDFKINIKLESCWDFLIDDCHLDDAKKYNILANNITASTISNCRIDDAGEDNVFITDSNIGTVATASVQIINCIIQRAKYRGIVLNKVVLPVIQNCFIEANNIAGGYPFIDVIGNNKCSQMFSMSNCYFTTAGKSSNDSSVLRFSNNVKIVNINSCFFGPRFQTDFIASEKLESISVESSQNKVKYPFSKILEQTKIFKENNYLNKKK